MVTSLKQHILIHVPIHTNLNIQIISEKNTAFKSQKEPLLVTLRQNQQTFLKFTFGYRHIGINFENFVPTQHIKVNHTLSKKNKIAPYKLIKLAPKRQ